MYVFMHNHLAQAISDRGMCQVFGKSGCISPSLAPRFEHRAVVARQSDPAECPPQTECPGSRVSDDPKLRLPLDSKEDGVQSEPVHIRARSCTGRAMGTTDTESAHLPYQGSKLEAAECTADPGDRPEADPSHYVSGGVPARVRSREEIRVEPESVLPQVQLATVVHPDLSGSSKGTCNLAAPHHSQAAGGAAGTCRSSFTSRVRHTDPRASSGRCPGCGSRRGTTRVAGQPTARSSGCCGGAGPPDRAECHSTPSSLVGSSGCCGVAESPGPAECRSTPSNSSDDGKDPGLLIRSTGGGGAAIGELGPRVGAGMSARHEHGALDAQDRHSAAPTLLMGAQLPAECQRAARACNWECPIGALSINAYSIVSSVPSPIMPANSLWLQPLWMQMELLQQCSVPGLTIGADPKELYICFV